MSAHRYDFASDNTAGICPEAWLALQEANAEADASYGEDRWTRRLCDLVREIFETDCQVFVVFNGTAANSLALAQLCRSHHSVICHEHAHIQTDECGAPEFFSGGVKLLPIAGENGKLEVRAMEETLLRQRELHSPKPRALSLTQSTELGTVYSSAELATMADFAKERGFYFHMDGARFANAIATLKCAPKEITGELGLDVLSLGGTKNGLAAGELVVFFNKELAADFDYRAKQAGQLASKMRFLAAPWVGLLQDDVWLRNARKANASAELLAQKLTALGYKLAFAREANAVFVQLPENLVAQLHDRGWHFYKFFEPDIYRLMCAWTMTETTIEDFVGAVKNAGVD